MQLPQYNQENPALINVENRRFMGQKDLLITLQTSDCSYRQCTHCDLHTGLDQRDTSYQEVILSLQERLATTDIVYDKIERLTLRNNGSVLDPKNFHPEVVNYLAGLVASFPRAQTFSVETRAEYVTAERLRGIKELIGKARINVTIGFETQDDVIRNKILRTE